MPFSSITERTSSRSPMSPITSRAPVGTAHSKPGRQPVEDDDLLAGCEQRQDRVAADVARTSGDQNGHAFNPALA